MAKLRPAIKIHGGKYYLAKWIIDHFPTHYESMTYIEPYCGGANVLLQKKPSKREVIGDIDPGVVAIYRIIRDMPRTFASRLRATPYKEHVFAEAVEKEKQGLLEGDLDYAVNETILRRMSRDGLKKAFAWSERQRGGRPGDVNAWYTFIEQITPLSERLHKVEIYHEAALNLIEEFDSKDTLFYCDPTYLPATRQTTKVYTYEMTEADHASLAEKLVVVEGKVLVSSYPSPQYDVWFTGWEVASKQIVNHASQQKKKQYKTECLWVNCHPEGHF